MQSPNLWQKLRAFIHRKTAPKPEPNPPPVKIPTFLWTFLTLIGTALLTGVCWVIITNTLGWQNNLVATGLIALFGLLMFSWPLSNWIQAEQSKEARKQAREKREQAREKREAIDWAEARAARSAGTAEARRLRNRGIVERLRDFIFGRPD